MNMAERDVCGKPSNRYSELGFTCCVAYTPKHMRGERFLGMKVRGAESPHRHMALKVLADGTVLCYKWAWRGNGEYWLWMPRGRGVMKPCTQEEWEKALREV